MRLCIRASVRCRFRAASEGYATLFDDSTTYVHACGHEIPMRLRDDEALLKALDDFFRRFRKRGQGARIDLLYSRRQALGVQPPRTPASNELMW